jgi:hypothetical protein
LVNELVIPASNDYDKSKNIYRKEKKIIKVFIEILTANTVVNNKYVDACF